MDRGAGLVVIAGPPSSQASGRRVNRKYCRTAVAIIAIWTPLGVEIH
jgi:hypothetical protein